MKFKTVAEAFNYYRNHSLEDIERRAAEIGRIIDTDPDADVNALNIELDGLKEAKKNIEERSRNTGATGGFNPVTGMNFQQGAQIPAGDELFATSEYRSAFYKNLLGQKLTEVETNVWKRAQELAEVERRADAFSTTTSAAAVLPTVTLNEVVSKARTMGGLISACRQFNIPSNLAVPIGTPASKAAWHVEGTPVESEEAVTTSVTFSAYELIKVFSMSVAAKRMTVDAFEAYIKEELQKCIMEAIADALVNGTGNDQGTGILTGVTWNAGNSATFPIGESPKYSDFTKVAGMLKRGYKNNAKWAMNDATLYGLVYGVTDLNERPIFIQDPRSDEIGRILGKPVIIDDHIPDDMILFGNFDYHAYNLAQGIMIEVSRESSFKSGLIDYRAMAIADCKPLVPEAFVRLKRATS